MNKQLHAFLEADAKRTQGKWKSHANGRVNIGVPEYQIHWSDDGECVAEIVHGGDDANFIALSSTLAPIIRELLTDMDKIREALELGKEWINELHENDENYVVPPISDILDTDKIDKALALAERWRG